MTSHFSFMQLLLVCLLFVINWLYIYVVFIFIVVVGGDACSFDCLVLAIAENDLDCVLLLRPRLRRGCPAPNEWYCLQENIVNCSIV